MSESYSILSKKLRMTGPRCFYEVLCVECGNWLRKEREDLEYDEYISLMQGASYIYYCPYCHRELTALAKNVVQIRLPIIKEEEK